MLSIRAWAGRHWADWFRSIWRSSTQRCFDVRPWFHLRSGLLTSKSCITLTVSEENQRFASGWIQEQKKDKVPTRHSKLLKMPGFCGRLSLKRAGGPEKIFTISKPKGPNIMRERGRSALSQS